VSLLSLLSTFQPNGRVKRFGDAPSSDQTDTGCGDGKIVKDGKCAECGKGTYADTNASPQKCELCAYDTYSTGAANKVCTACDTGKGTLQIGSDEAGDCIGKSFFIFPWLGTKYSSRYFESHITINMLMF
jgi:hypothetical protein